MPAPFWIILIVLGVIVAFVANGLLGSVMILIGLIIGIYEWSQGHSARPPR